ncbi:BCCT family transporter [Rhodobacteraceae bacterium MYP1-1]|uniref:BCCT family transporter n=1 Tax=Halocynthiibacter styelae TaxID=2761955 RepID=A0A8J7IEW7_9RHOB|nr:BCCT family transporter [Paenihalocynthiibacter styelae]
MGQINSFILATFNFWYVYAMAFFVLTCVVFAAWPAAGRLKPGLEDDKPEFSNFSWFSMMFGAGIGIGMLTFATAEPVYHFVSNPSTIQGLTESPSAYHLLGCCTGTGCWWSDPGRWPGCDQNCDGDRRAAIQFRDGSDGDFCTESGLP